LARPERFATQSVWIFTQSESDAPQSICHTVCPVSQGDLETALNTQSSNISNDVSFLNFSVNDPPTQQDVQLVLDKVDELLQALRR